MIVVTTPSGHIGSQVVANLLAANEAVRVIARDPARLAAEVRAKLEIVPVRAMTRVCSCAIQTDFSGGVVRDNPKINKRVAEMTALGVRACQMISDR